MGYRLAQVGNDVVEVHISGPRDAQGMLVFHVGAPNAAVGYPGLTAAAARHGLQTLIYSRPGYGRSGRTPGRRVADEATRTLALVERSGFRDFFVAGWSGGGPAALACAALLPDRVRACVSLASLTPRFEVGEGWREWYPDADAREHEVLASEERATLVPDYEAGAREFGRATPAWLASFPGSTSPSEALVTEARLRVPLARSMRRALRAGMWGWFDDAVALANPWGFRVADIRVPVVVRHGDDDHLVDVRHGRWLAATIPGAVARILPNRGHGAVVLPFAEMVDELVQAERRP